LFKLILFDENRSLTNKQKKIIKIDKKMDGNYNNKKYAFLG